MLLQGIVISGTTGFQAFWKTQTFFWIFLIQSCFYNLRFSGCSIIQDDIFQASICFPFQNSKGNASDSELRL